MPAGSWSVALRGNSSMREDGSRNWPASRRWCSADLRSAENQNFADRGSALLLPQSLHGIELGGSSRRQVSGQAGDHGDQGGRGQQHGIIVRLDAEELIADGGAEHHRGHSAEQQTEI